MDAQSAPGTFHPVRRKPAVTLLRLLICGSVESGKSTLVTEIARQ